MIMIHGIGTSITTYRNCGKYLRKSSIEKHIFVLYLRTIFLSMVWYW